MLQHAIELHGFSKQNNQLELPLRFISQHCRNGIILLAYFCFDKQPVAAYGVDMLVPAIDKRHVVPGPQQHVAKTTAHSPGACDCNFHLYFLTL